MAPTAPAPTVVPIAVLLNIEQMRLDAWRGGPLVLDRGPASQSGPGGTTGLINMIRGALLPLELRSEPRVLLPRHTGRTWVLPLVVVARNPASPAPGVPGLPLAGVLAELARDLDDPSIVAEATQVIGGAAACDELMTRVTGEGTRTLAQLKRDAGRPWSGSVASPVPWVVAGLPEQFSLTDLHRTVMAWMGGDHSAGPTDSPSNFRRRVNDLVLSGVLEELPGSGRSADADRPGRPPRMFRFSESAWLSWLLRRSGASTHAGDAEDSAALLARQPTLRLESSLSAKSTFESAFRGETDDSRLFIELRNLLRKYSQGQ